MKTPALIALLLTAASAIAGNTKVTWQSLGNDYTADKKPCYTQRFVIKGDTRIKHLGFNMFARKMQPVNELDTITEVFPGYYLISSPRFNGADSVVVDIKTYAHLVGINYAPDGLHAVRPDNKVDAIDYQRIPLTKPEQWVTSRGDKMPYGPEVYDFNESLKTDWQPGVYDVIPSFGSVKLTGGNSVVTDKNIVFKNVKHSNPDFYRITVKNDKVVIECARDKQWPVTLQFIGKVMLGQDKAVLPNAVIESAPDFAWRGLHVDISRNYQTVDQMKKVVSLLSANGFNRLHLHLADDEAWRLEIPGLPELTDIGSRRGYSDHGEDQYLYQIFAGDGNPDSKTGSANGYWTREQFIDFIRESHWLGVDVLVEIESPGHARAAIKAMEARHRNGDDYYRLIEDGDTSIYTSAQSYHDNAMNVALPGPARFMEKVITEIAAMYAEAGVPMVGIHIGGDEVPRGAWNGAPSVQKLMAESDGKLATQHDVHGMFVRQMADICRQKGIKMYGWEEVAVGYGPEFNADVAPVTGGVNCWHATPDAANKALANGYNAILGNVDRLYLDMMYTPHPHEQGLQWGGYVDEFSTLSAYADSLVTIPEADRKGEILGLQGQIWAETIRNGAQLERMMLPKMFGLAERSWHAKPTYTPAQYNKIIGQKELPLFSRIAAVHLRQPGIKVIDGKVYMNAPYDGGEIRFTVDGTEPTASSPIYRNPFPVKDLTDVRARYFRNNAESVTTYLFEKDK